ncbi:MAG: hypothetical protein AAB250_12830, partial [Bdellovibrionota bacterium]
MGANQAQQSEEFSRPDLLCYLCGFSLRKACLRDKGKTLWNPPVYGHGSQPFVDRKAEDQIADAVEPDEKTT